MTQVNKENGFNTLQDKLDRIKHHTKINTFKTDDSSVLPAVDKIGIDGIDHINIWEKASTELGIALSHMADLPFTHETFGKFRSVEGFWHYIRSVTRDDRNRMMAGYKAKKFGDSLESRRVDDFKAIIMDANWQKVKQYAPIVDEIKNSTLPFDVYYLFNNDVNVRIRPASAFWLIEGFNEIRKCLKENTKPDFTFLRDRQNQNKDSETTLNKTKVKQKYVPGTLSQTLIDLAKTQKVSSFDSPNNDKKNYQKSDEQIDQANGFK
jgi:hypothetical protein